ncbi:cell division protein FtsQ/DivIB [Shimia aestuarii]|uniref:Cell division protein FtsQ n=1 Tax=Shimia aestuarii TaxID=254406 RepID=A0A1I4LTI1_9RHOB|nr:cell division protein FtsQ/DivIB [Shimia aestuarii]SFL94408.1 cell division protein FtsQ [Shimia aestuarii]
MQSVGQRCDPAPSRWAYRLQRLLLTPLFRFALRVVVPFLLVAGLTLLWFSDQDRRDQLAMAYNDLRTEIATRPEFMVNAMAIDGASKGIAEDIREIMPIDFPTSSFDLELGEIQERVSELPAVAKASVRVRPGGILQVAVVERDPVILWRTYDGLALVDREGYVTGPARARTLHPDLPLMAGEGADRQVAEAVQLYAAAGPLAARVRGLVRVGERRWDVVLDRGQRILLPEIGAVQALERVIALSEAQDLLERNLLVVDMRLAARPTIRLAEAAVEEWWRISQLSFGKSNND